MRQALLDPLKEVHGVSDKVLMMALSVLFLGASGHRRRWLTDMQADLDRERKTMMRLWAKREEQNRGVVGSTAGLYGDLQGIAGRSLVEIDGLELPLLDGPARDAAE
jgi:hypothetical protein